MRLFITLMIAASIGSISFITKPANVFSSSTPSNEVFIPPVEDSVLICKSSNAYAYHKKYCQGLNRCTHTVEKVTLTRAKDLGYEKACGYCYR